MRRMSRVGFGVSNNQSAFGKSTSEISSFFASWVWPTSSYVHSVCGTRPSLTSLRNRLIAGTLLPSCPHQILLPISISASLFFETRQYVPGGGPSITRPEGHVIGYVHSP